MDTQLHTLPCRSIGQLVHLLVSVNPAVSQTVCLSITFLNSNWILDSGPEGDSPVKHRGTFVCSFVHLFVHPSDCPFPPGPLRPEICPFRPEIALTDLKSILLGLKSALSSLESALSDLKYYLRPAICPLRPQICPLSLRF